MIVSKFVCLNLYNCLWFIISLLSLWCWEASFSQVSWSSSLLTRLLGTAAGNAGALFPSSLPKPGTSFQGFGDFMQKLIKISLSRMGIWHQLHPAQCFLWGQGTRAHQWQENDQPKLQTLHLTQYPQQSSLPQEVVLNQLPQNGPVCKEQPHYFVR